MKRKISALLCLTIALMSTACTKTKAVETTVTETSGTSASAEQTSAPEETTIEETTTETSTVSASKHEPMKHEFQNCVYPQFYQENFGGETEKAFRAYCDAVINGENKFYCPDEGTLEKMWWIACDLMPLGEYYVTSQGMDKDEPIAYIEYTIPHDEYMKRVEEFKELITGILDETCMSGYTDLEKALAIYVYFQDNYTYDYTYKSHRPYGALTEHTGICQDFSGAYAYLLNQAGVEAVSCGAMNDEDAHEWNAVMIDGKYYHVDPTFGIGSDTLRYFGMSDKRRQAEGDWDMQFLNFSYNVFNKNGRYDMEDERFAPLADSLYCEIDYENNVITFTSEKTGKEETFNYADMSDFVAATPVPSPVELVGEEAAPVSHELNPHVYTDFFEDMYDEGTKTAFFAFCDAVLAGEAEFDCPDQDTLDTILNTIAPELMPLVKFLDASKCSVKEGKAHLEYELPKEECLTKVEEFKAAVTAILDNCCREGYNDFGNALALYEYFGTNVAYDWENDGGYDPETDGYKDPSPILTTYRLLTERIGSSDNMSDAYVYLLAQVGVSAITAASTDDEAYADGYTNFNLSWTIIKLNDEYYSTSVFFNCNDPDRTIRHFGGITTDMYAAENLHLANIKIDANKYKINETLAELFNMSYDYEVDYVDGKIYYYVGKEPDVYDFKDEVKNSSDVNG